MSALRPVFSLRLLSDSGDPFPQCAHWGLPLRGAALRGIVETGAEDATDLSLRGTSDVAVRIPLRRTKTIDSPKENGFPRLASPSCDGGFAA